MRAQGLLIRQALAHYASTTLPTTFFTFLHTQWPRHKELVDPVLTHLASDLYEHQTGAKFAEAGARDLQEAQTHWDYMSMHL